MVTINPLDVFFWTIRRNEKDVVTLYDSLSPVMQLATGGTMLNFGYWDENNSEPISAQNHLCSFFADIAELDTAKTAVDVGSGLAAPAQFWRKQNQNLDLFCININHKQLSSSDSHNLELVNSTSTQLPFLNNSVDRVLALESAQHFKPLKEFISEAKRILKNSGILAIAIPITMDSPSLRKLGILKFTWSSEHYPLDYVKQLIVDAGFKITREELIGPQVYDPLADYYASNREKLRQTISQHYPDYVESILYKSILKMKKASENKFIDYLILKCITN